MLDAKKLTVACGEGAVTLVEVQLAGSKRMASVDFLRGSTIDVGIQLGKEEN